MPRSSLPTEQHPHARYNPLRDGWVLVSAHWVKRPWQGQLEKLPPRTCPSGTPTTPSALGPPGPTVNPQYEGTFVFPNDFPVLQPDQGHRGKVMCFHPWSDLTLPLVFPAEIWAVINTWAELLAKLGASYPWVQIFENKGVMMGCSNPYPHCQVCTSSFIPIEVRLEDRTQQQHLSQHSMPMLLEYAEQEACWKVRVAGGGECGLAVPYWATWPFQILLLPCRHIRRLQDLCKGKRDSEWLHTLPGPESAGGLPASPEPCHGWSWLGDWFCLFGYPSPNPAASPCTLSPSPSQAASSCLCSMLLQPLKGSPSSQSSLTGGECCLPRGGAQPSWPIKPGSKVPLPVPW
uniref:Galactose-1-phosphate uridylyltransferase n=1 Tax=Buteo japonicus TaxID=224669 RepID=A0A8C0BZI7_9AVES